MKVISKLVATGALCLVAPLAAAQNLEPWDFVAGWEILIDPSLGDGCLIQSEFTDGSLVRIGFDLNEGMGYVTAFNYEWGDIIEGQMYDISFELDSQYFEGVAEGIYLEDVPGADIYFDNPDFLFAIAERYTMTLYHDGYEVMAIDLAGTYRALEAAIECQNEIG